MKKSATILMHIDSKMHIELATLFNSIFGKKNHIETFCWKKRSSAAMQSKFSQTQHEYILAYAKDIKKTKWNGIPQFDPKDKHISQAHTSQGKSRKSGPNQAYPLHVEGKEYKLSKSTTMSGKVNGGENQKHSLYVEPENKLEGFRKVGGRDNNGSPHTKEQIGREYPIYAKENGDKQCEFKITGNKVAGYRVGQDYSLHVEEADVYDSQRLDKVSKTDRTPETRPNATYSIYADKTYTQTDVQGDYTTKQQFDLTDGMKGSKYNLYAHDIIGDNPKPQTSQIYNLYTNQDGYGQYLDAPHNMTIQSKQSKQRNLINQGYPLYTQIDGYGQYHENQLFDQHGAMREKGNDNNHYQVFGNQQRISLTPFPGSVEIKPMNGNADTQMDHKYMHKIYCITNTENNKSYVGYTSKTVEQRLKDHFRNMSSKPKSALYGAMKKYGKDKFIIQEIECFENEVDALGEEQFWIEYLGTMAPNGYNLVEGGGKPPSQANYSESHIGHEVTDETKAKIKASRKLQIMQPVSDETKTKISMANFDKHRSNAKYAEKTKYGKWCSRVKLGGKRVYVGTFETEKEATDAGQKAVADYEEAKKGTMGCWRCIPSTCKKLIDANMLVVKYNKQGQPKIYQKQYANFTFNRKTGKLEPFIRTTPIASIILEPTNTRSNKEIKEIFGKTSFTYAKPLQLVKRLLKVVSNENDMVLDLFAGSGTTGQAAFEINRQFILCQLDEGGIPLLTQERLNKTIGKTNYEVIT